jgi:hypothetical protein
MGVGCAVGCILPHVAAHLILSDYHKHGIQSAPTSERKADTIAKGSGAHIAHRLLKGTDIMAVPTERNRFDQVTIAKRVARTLGYRVAAKYLRNQGWSLDAAIYILLGI